MAVGMTPSQQKEVENIIHYYAEKSKTLQLDKLVMIEGAEGHKFMIPPFGSEGEKLKGEFVAQLRNTLDETTYLRFMTYGVKEVYSVLGDFGESKIEFAFQNDNGEISPSQRFKKAKNNEPLKKKKSYSASERRSGGGDLQQSAPPLSMFPRAPRTSLRA